MTVAELSHPSARQLIVALSVLAAMAFVLASGSATPAATPGLVAAFAFDEGSGSTVADASGNGNNGTVANATWVAGKYGKALSFNGSSSRVTVPDSASLHLSSAMTLEAWVDPTTTTAAWRDAIYKGNDNYYLEGTSDQSGKPGAGGTFGGTVYGSSALPVNAWTHLAVTYDKTTVRLYVNGTQVGTLAATGAIASSTNPLSIGSDALYGQYFSGLIDDVRVYNTALTAAQIQTDMTTPVAPPAPDTTPPSAPGTLTASAISSSRVDLSWGAATDNVGVTGYHIERCQGTGCTTFTEIGTPSTTSYSDTSAAAGTSYSYRVRANDAAGNLGPYSNTATATTPNPDTQPPSAPGTLTASAISSSRVDLSWGAATDNVGVTGYHIERCQGTGCTTFTEIGTPSTTSYSDTSAAAGTSYSYRVRANDAAGNLGPYSNTATATTPVPSGPTPVAAYAFDEGSGSTVADASGNGNNGTVANATWVAGKYGKALSFNGSSSRVTVPDSASLHLSSAMTLEAWVDPTTTTAAWRDAIYKGNDNYYLEGTSDQSGKPGAGGTFGGTVYGSSALPVNAWTHLAVTYDKTTVRLYVNGTQVGTLAATGAIASSTNPLSIGSDALYGQYFSGLIDDVRVYNTALTAAQIQTDMTTPVAPPAPDTTPPSAPGTLTASAISSSRVDLSWGAATDNVGVTGYHIERCQGTGCTTFTEIGTPSTTSYSDTSAAAGTSYSYRVRANDAAGNLGPYSNTATATTPNPDTQPPSAPGTLTASAISSSRVDLSWGAATDNVGVTGYHIERCQGTGCTTFTEIGTPSTTSYSDTSAAAGTSYSYRVRANDAAGNLGPYSNTATATTPVPSGPTPVAAYAFDEGSGSTVADASGNGNNGTVANATWVAGKYGKALSFNGSSSRVTVPDSASLHLSSAMTLEAWVDPTTTTAAWRDAIYKGNDNYYLEGTSDQSGKPGAGGTFGGTVYGSSALPVNAWTHLAVTYDKTTVRLYVNGTQVGTLAATGAIASSTNPLSIGSDALYGQYFSGLIDDVRVYNTALTAAQIQTDMTTPVAASNYPSAPGTLTATATSSSEVDLAWGVATANLPVTGYQVERCQGAGCSNFTQIATPTGTSYNDTSLTANTTYSYRVRAVDAAGVGPYSNTATTFTGLTISPRVTDLTFTRTQQFTVQGATSVNWSVDGVIGGNSSSGTITSTGLYTPPTSVGTHTVMATTPDQSQSVSATVYVTNYAGTFTYHNDVGRTGENVNEVALTPTDVNQSTFGKLFSYPLDGLTFASPLYVANVNIPGKGYHNVVYVATEHDSVYAFDADGLSSTPLWHDSFIDPANGITPVPAVDTGETGDIPNEIGITSTPVIDPTTGTLYVDAATKQVSGGTTTYYHKLHALDITTGAEKSGSPVTIQASVPGTGMGSQGGTLSFVPLRQNQRTGLLLSNGVVYLGFSSRGDVEPFHGWVLGYNATTLQQVMVYCTTPNGDDGGVWMSGDGVAADPAGYLYFITGDGAFDASSGSKNDYGDSFVKINAASNVLDYFTPQVQSSLNSGNLDLGSGGPLLLPDQPGAHPHEMVGAGKNGTIYLVDRDNMGHFHSNSDQIVQSIVNIWTNVTGGESGLFGAPVYFNGSVYFSPLADTVQAFQLTNGLLTTTPTSQSAETYDGTTNAFDSRGGTLAISANGTTNGILWALESKGDSAPGVLHAYDAANLANELYNSSQAGSRDALDPWLKFTPPVVANGRVYVASSGQLTVYGLLP